ncbi:MAG: hypothetical protein ACT4N8_02250 [Sphingosinicella sp.]|uniref:hypothetical protein n=1 Tax=Sphingosinicella sp. TaxID=1917971 RepID=UPI0040383CB7
MRHILMGQLSLVRSLPEGLAGEAVRALAWLGPTKGREALSSLKLPPDCREEMASVSAILPLWMAEVVDEIAGWALDKASV